MNTRACFVLAWLLHLTNYLVQKIDVFLTEILLGYIIPLNFLWVIWTFNNSPESGFTTGADKVHFVNDPPTMKKDLYILYQYEAVMLQFIVQTIVQKVVPIVTD